MIPTPYNYWLWCQALGRSVDKQTLQCRIPTRRTPDVARRWRDTHTAFVHTARLPPNPALGSLLTVSAPAAIRCDRVFMQGARYVQALRESFGAREMELQRLGTHHRSRCQWR
eukprot:6603344-Prymnesium_polylepis.1